MKNIKHLNIGLTINLNKDSGVWSNGIIQNVVYLYQSLKCSNNQYNVCITDCGEYENLEDFKWAKDLNLVKLKDVIQELDLLILIGSQVTDNDINNIHKNNGKVVFYQCGSNYILNMEDVLFKEEDNNFKYTKLTDEIWMIPQNEYINYHYLKVMHNTHTVVVPFVWGSKFLDMEKENLPNKAVYNRSVGSKRISIFEPNINVVKFFMYPLLIAERLNKINPTLIKTVFVTNTLRYTKNKKFSNLVTNLDISKSKIATFEKRYITPYFLAHHTDVVVSHQWGNPLNYAYLDALYLGYPLVHNADFCKEAGYYYEGFNIEEGANQLQKAIEEHDKYIDEYNYRSSTVLKRYKYDNPHTVVYYDKLIHNVMNNIKNDYTYQQKNNF